MRALLQRVTEASVTIDGTTSGAIEHGLLILLGISTEDDASDIDWLCKKIVNLRIFNDEEGKMNRSVQDVEGDLLVVSQFTLQADTKKGNRPSYIKAARPEQAIPLYEKFVQTLKVQYGQTVATGQFGADMKVRLLNDGPVTIWLDSRAR